MPEKDKKDTKPQSDNWVAIGSYMPKIVGDALGKYIKPEVEK